MNEFLQMPETERQKVEHLVEISRGRVDEVKELIDLDFIQVDDRYSFEQMLEEPTEEEEMPENIWEGLTELQKRMYLEEMGKVFDVDLLNIQNPELLDRREDGILETRTEGMVGVITLQTNDSRINIEVMDYRKPDLGLRFDLVRVK